MSFIRILVFIFFTGRILFAQQIYFCKSVNPDGKPVEHKLNWEIKGNTALFILLENTQLFKNSMIYLFIDRMVAGNYEAYDSKAILTDNNKNWVSYSYNFKESGNYSIYFINNSGERLASNKLTVRVTAKQVVENIAKEPGAENIIFNTDIVFCEKVTANKPVNLKETVSLKNGGNIVVFIKSENTFNTNTLIVHIYKKKGNLTEDLIQTKKFKTEASWRNIFFKYKFESPGEYKFSVYDEFENLIKSAGFLVTQ
jgi:hypothetical protein